MLKNYIKVALRSLGKQKVYTAINITGLAVSITACLLIVLYVKHELSYDKFFPNADRIYKLVLERKYPNHSTFFSIVPHSYAGTMQRDFPEVENNLHMLGPNPNTLVSYKVDGQETKAFEENFFFFADTSFFSFFDVPLLKGDKKTALVSPNQLIISQSTATRYFGNQDPIGKALSGNFGEFKITGVFDDLPANAHIKFDFVGSFDNTEFRKQENYISFDAHTYIRVKPGVDVEALEAKFPKMIDTYAAGQIERELKQSWTDYQKAGNGYRYSLQPLTNIHLDPTNYEFTLTPSGNLKYIKVLSFIALMILVIACINFMNLATARSAERSREVGVRKVMGSLKAQLVAQFLTEAFLLSLVSTALAVGAVLLLLPQFNTMVEKQLQFTPDFLTIGSLIVVALSVGLLAGLYPAFVLSGYSPVVAMKGKMMGNASGTWLRNGLVIIQFTISIVLIVSTLIVSNQMDFVQNKDLGFDKEQVLIIERAGALGNKTQTFLEELKKIPEVQSAAATSARVGNRDDFFGQMFQPEGSHEVLTVKSMITDDDFAELIDFELADGKFFNKASNDSLHVILNETAVKTIGLQDPIGRRLSNTDLFRNDPERSKERFFTVIGVVKNFHFQSLRDEVTPLVIFSSEVFSQQANANYLAVRLKPGSYNRAVEKIEARWEEFVPDRGFRFQFLDDNLNHSYVEEQRSGKMFTIFSALGIVIACVGLFGLSAYTASLRTKEIGIRKVLGATVFQAIVLLSKDFTRLILAAFVVSVPLAWWMMDRWLSNFAYHISLTAGPFITAGVIALAIAGLTVSYQSLRAAVANPVKSLKSE